MRHDRKTITAYYVAGRKPCIIVSVWARCWDCLETFPALRTEWHSTDDCGFCPSCGMDTVVGDSAGLKMDDEALLGLREQQLSY